MRSEHASIVGRLVAATAACAMAASEFDRLRVAFALMCSRRHACMGSSIATNPIAKPEAKDGKDSRQHDDLPRNEHPYLRA